jgi:uncharacterized protein YbaP (TraB family)
MRLIAALILCCFAGIGSARSAECEGTSLLPEIQRERADVWRLAETEFAAAANGTGLLWKIEKEGVAASWLFGTIHVPDPEVTTLPPGVASAFDAARVLAVESAEIFDPEREQELAVEMLTAAQMPEGTSFDGAFSQETKAALGEMTASHGVPYFAARKLKPWFVAIMLSLPPCSSVAALQGQPVLDEKLYLDAVASGKEVVGLETAAEQLAAVRGLDQAVGPEALLEVLKLGPAGIEDWYATMLDLYGQEKAALIQELAEAMPEFAFMATAMRKVEGSLVISRNLLMRDRALPLLEAGGAFIAVGALHLSGDSGLVELLRDGGYTVTRVPLRAGG